MNKKMITILHSKIVLIWTYEQNFSVECVMKF